MISESLILDELPLNDNLLREIKSNCISNPDFVKDVILIRNGLDDKNMSLLFNSFIHLKDLKRIIIKNNSFGEFSLSALK